MLGMIESRRRRGQQKKRWLGGIDTKDMSLSELQYSYVENLHGQRSVEGYIPWGCRVRHD